jgi:Zn-dependent protease
MAFISISEIIDIIIMSAFVGYIFMDMFGRFKKHDEHEDYIKSYMKKKPSFFGLGAFDWEAFKFSILVTAPAIVLHELGHKFTALAFGLSAQFHAAYFWLFIGLVLKLINFGFIFFVPAYVNIIGNPAPLVSSAIAFAGPFVNCLLWLLSSLLLNTKIFGKINKRYVPYLFLTKRINMFLFIFNMLPLPMFDGFKVFDGIIKAISGIG